jgi:signal peptidase I
MKSTVAPPPSDVEPSIFDVRRTARRRALICPGAGYALLGRPLAANVAYLTGIGTLLAAIWTVWSPSRAGVVATLALLVISTIAWVTELIAVNTSWPKRPVGAVAPPYGAKTAAMWVCIAILAALVVFTYRVLQVGGIGMEPKVHEGDRLLFRRGVSLGDLRRGTPVLFRLHADNKFTEPGTLVLARILAVPGDRLQIRDGRYYLNDVADREVPSTQPYPRALEIATEPGTAIVPEKCYFVIQDSPDEGLDSRVLSWARREDILSTRFWSLSSFPPLKPIE